MDRIESIGVFVRESSPSRFSIKMSGRCAGAAERHVAFDGVRAELADLADAGKDLVSIVVPIMHSHFTV